jgi:CII-binding regulator of phage lambda lysogenization HflD
MATTLRDALEDAFKEVEEPEETLTEAPTGVVEEALVDSKPRDEQGRFAKTEQETPEPEPEVIQEPPVKKAPSSWKKDYWSHWEKLTKDPELSTLAEYIEQRESEFAKGVSTYKAEADRGKALVEAVTPYEPILRQHGLEPAQHVKSLMDAHYALAMGNPEQKLQMFAKLATDYGVPLQGLTGQVDPQMSVVAQELATVKQSLAAIQQFKQQQEAATVQQQIEAFKRDKPHFEEVRNTMAQILERGQASDLNEAYELAIFRSPEIRSRIEAQQAQERMTQAQKAAQAKKATAVSPKPSSPGAAVPVQGKASLRDTLSANLDNILSGRV